MMENMNFSSIEEELLNKINNVKPDLIFAKELYGAYGGEYGELSAVTQYVYEQMVLSNKELGSEILTIAIEEMRHLNILRKTISSTWSSSCF